MLYFCCDSMKINNNEVNIDNLMDEINIDKIILKHRNNGLLLSDYQISVLKRFDIDYSKFSNSKELMYNIEDVLDECYDEELDLISSQLAELIYYTDTKK